MIQRSVLTRRTVLAALGSVAIAGCASRGATVGAAAQKVAVLHTSAGQIGIAVGTIAAPKNSAYFLKLVEDRSLVGHRFWRSGHFQGDDRRGLFVEGGMLDSYILGEESPIPPTIAATGLPTLEDWETTEQSGLNCVRGSVFLRSTCSVMVGLFLIL